MRRGLRLGVQASQHFWEGLLMPATSAGSGKAIEVLQLSSGTIDPSSNQFLLYCDIPRGISTGRARDAYGCRSAFTT